MKPDIRMRRGNVHWPTDQVHGCAPSSEFACDGVAHFAAGVVGDVPHRVYRLLGGPGRDEYFLTLEVLGGNSRLYFIGW